MGLFDIDLVIIFGPVLRDLQIYDYDDSFCFLIGLDVVKFGWAFIGCCSSTYLLIENSLI